MITCQLTKLESALDNVRKAYPSLAPTDAALIASALTLTGRHALASYEGEQYVWPDDNERLEKALAGDIAQRNEDLGEPAPVKKTAKPVVIEEEPSYVPVGLVPNLSAGERLLEGREDLKTLLGDIVQEGVEFVYSGQDIGWQWALDRATWSTITDKDISRRVKVKAQFIEGAVGVETGANGAKKKTPKAPKAAPVADPAADPAADAADAADEDEA